MKRKILLIVLSSFMIMGIVSASSMWGEYKGKPIIRLTVDGVPMKVSDAPAVLMDDRTMVPIYLLEQAGIQYTWDGKNQTVDVKKNTSIDADNNMVQTKELIKLVKYYKELEDFGETILDSSNRLFVLSEDMMYLDINTSTKSAEDHLNGIASELNAWNTNSAAMVNSYSPAETKIYEILKSYTDAYQLYSDALVKLIRFKMNVNSGNKDGANEMLDTFYSLADQAHQKISVAIKSTSDRNAILLDYLSKQ